MADIPFPKLPGGTNFGTTERFKTPKSRSPGPLEYETASTLNFSSSMLSVSSSQPSFAFSGKYALPGEAARARDAGKGDTPLYLPGSIGPQPSSRIRSSASFSMGPKHSSYAKPLRVQTPSPLAYTLPRSRLYEDRRDRSFGSDDRFGDSGARAAVYIPHSTSYGSAFGEMDAVTRTDTRAQMSVPFTGRSVTRTRERSPGPCADGAGGGAKNQVMHAQPAWSMGLKGRPDTGAGSSGRPMQPSPITYNPRTLYWTGKKDLGRSGTTFGRARSAIGPSVHY